VKNPDDGKLIHGVASLYCVGRFLQGSESIWWGVTGRYSTVVICKHQKLCFYLLVDFSVYRFTKYQKAAVDMQHTTYIFVTEPA